MDGDGMDRLQLATLLSWAGERGLNGRKRLQKVVFFLQHAGCQLDVSYTLHNFGPYSRDVADICDEMVSAGLIEETSGSQGGSFQYAYALKPDTRTLLEQTSNPEMARHQELGTRLINEDLWSLELGSTILYFYQQCPDWNVAMRKACEYKQVPIDASRSTKALGLAKEISTVSVH